MFWSYWTAYSKSYGGDHVAASMRFSRPRGSTVCILLLAMVLLAQVAVLLFWSNERSETVSGGDQDTIAPVVYQQGAVVSFGEEVTFRFAAGEAPWEDSLELLRLDSLELTDVPGTLTAAYNVDFQSGRQLSQPVQVTMSCEEEIDGGTMNPSNGLWVMHMNEETGVWENVPCRYDSEAMALVCYLDHFSVVGIGECPPSPHPLMTLGVTDREPLEMAAVIDIQWAEQILQAHCLTQDPESVESAVLAGTRMFTEAFDLVSVPASALEQVLGVSELERFNAISGEIGLLAALTRFTLEVSDTSTTNREAQANLLQSLLSYSVGKWGWQGLQIANIGIFMMNYSLQRFGTAAVQARFNLWWRKYHEYNRFNNLHRMTQLEWNDFMVRTVMSSAELSSEVVQNALAEKVDLYLNAFFNDDFYNIGGFWFFQGPCPDDLRPSLIGKEREELLPVLEAATYLLEDRVRFYQELDMLEQLNNAADLLNSRQQIRVQVYGDSVGDPRVRNLQVRIPVASDQDLWQGVTDEPGQWWFDLTRYGYLHYNSPSVVELEFEGDIYTQPILVETWGGFADVRFYLDETEGDTLIHVTSDPSGATVYLDGANTGQVTPAEISGFQPGSHSLRVFLEGYNEYVTSFDIAEGESRRVHADLGEPQPPLPVFSHNLTDNQAFTDNVINISGSISLMDGEGNTSPFQGTTAILTLNGSDREIAVQNGQFSVELSIPSGPSVISFRANSHNGDTGVSNPITINGDFSVPGIEITLTWNSPTSDLDLHVYNPAMEHSCWQSTSISDGFLDIDDVDGFGPETFTAETPMSGPYIIQVNCYSMDEDSYSYATVMVHVNGQLQETYGPHPFSVGDGMSGDPVAWWDVATIQIQ